MYSELTGWVPKLPVDLSKTLIKRAWADVRRSNLWSFQLYEANWVSPAVLTTGTVTVTQGLNTVVFDAAATTAITPLATSGPFPTNLLQRQFRVGVSTIYNIWSFQLVGGFAQLTLDRPYTDAGGSAQAYQILQCYYPAPFKDHLLWMNVRDIVNFNDLNIWGTRYQIDLMDPQRTLFYLPTWCVPYQNDQNPASKTYGFPMFELWGVPQYVLTYQLYGIRRGPDLVNDSDVLPVAVGEDAVVALGKYYAYQWAESNKGDQPRNQGTDFKFLMGAAKTEYDRLVRDYRRQDKETVDNWYNVRRRPQMFSNIDGYYNAIGMTANAGSPW